MTCLAHPLLPRIHRTCTSYLTLPYLFNQASSDLSILHLHTILAIISQMPICSGYLSDNSHHSKYMGYDIRGPAGKDSHALLSEVTSKLILDTRPLTRQFVSSMSAANM